MWKLRKVAGGSEHTLRIRATLEEGLGGAGVRRGVGPVSLAFTIPMHCVSRLQVRRLALGSDLDLARTSPPSPT